MIEKAVLRLMIGVGLPIASALVIEQLPKTGVAEVPFAFQVMNHTFPPGTYSVKQADMGRTIRIQNKKIAGVGMECVAAKSQFGRAQDARLVFKEDGGVYLLSEIWFDEEGRGLILQETHAQPRTQAEAGAFRYVLFQ